MCTINKIKYETLKVLGRTCYAVKLELLSKNGFSSGICTKAWRCNATICHLLSTNISGENFKFIPLVGVEFLGLGGGMEDIKFLSLLTISFMVKDTTHLLLNHISWQFMAWKLHSSDIWKEIFPPVKYSFNKGYQWFQFQLGQKGKLILEVTQ